MGGRLRRAGMRLLAALQRLSWYRPLMRRLVGRWKCARRRRRRISRSANAGLWRATPASGPHSEVTTYIALAGKHIAGWYHLQRNDSETLMPGFVLTGLYVRLRYRGLGLARLSMQAFRECAADQGVHEALLVVDTTNKPAITLYRSMGFAVAEDGPWTARMEEVHRRYGVNRWSCVCRLMRGCTWDAVAQQPRARSGGGC